VWDLHPYPVAAELLALPKSAANPGSLLLNANLGKISIKLAIQAKAICAGWKIWRHRARPYVLRVKYERVIAPHIFKTANSFQISSLLAVQPLPAAAPAKKRRVTSRASVLRAVLAKMYDVILHR
jgi:hypothetical protein